MNESPANDVQRNHRAKSVSPPSRHRLLKVSKTVGIVLAIGGLIFLAQFRVQRWLRDPHVYLLVDETDAKWIRTYHAFNLGVHNYHWPRKTLFRCDFDLSEPVTDARLSIQAFRQFKVWLDSAPEHSMPLFTGPIDLKLWKERYEIRLPDRLAQGKHRLLVLVENKAAHPCLLASSPELGIHSGASWEVKETDRDWSPAVLASERVRTVPQKAQEAGYTSVVAAFLQIWPWLAVVFGISFAWTWWRPSQSLLGKTSPAWALSPSRLRWILLIAWLVMSINNFQRVAVEMGFDQTDHVAYVLYILKHGSIPLASDGWQMFQSPLQYLIAAPYYSLCARLFSPEFSVKLLRLLPLFAAMAQIEIAYRAGRKVFPGQDDLQLIVTTVGGMMPMNLYMSQTFCNEPLAGTLTAVVILMCLSLTSEPERQRGFLFYASLGIVWGLALLTKVTPLILAPVIIASIVFAEWTNSRSLRKASAAVLITFGACFVTAGWYFIRNWIFLGAPFIGGWDPSRGILWWQDPSYRTWSQLTSFGAALIQPVYSGVDSFWDSIYSTMWLDGYLSSTFPPARDLSWNFRWMEVGAWTALLPQCCMLLGAAMLFDRSFGAARRNVLFALAVIGIYFSAILDMYLQIPIYSAAKASYALGLLPCFGILAAAGSVRLLQIRLLRSLFFAGLTCWATAAYAAYFCLK